jgi:hypothetical protein
MRVIIEKSLDFSVDAWYLKLNELLVIHNIILELLMLHKMNDQESDLTKHSLIILFWLL